MASHITPDTLRSLRYRLGVASRAIAAILGGYGVAALFTALFSLILPMSRAEAVTTSTLLSFLVYACAAIWVFAARTAWRAWTGLIVPAALMGAWLMALKGAA